MTSRIIVNNIQSDAGVSTVFFNSDIGGTSGTLNVDGNLNVGGVVTYDDVTNIDSVGIITARSDVSIADKIVHTGDTDTAIRFPGADQVSIETGGTQRLLIGSDGKMGVGTQNPGVLLELSETNADPFNTVITHLKLNNSGGNGGSGSRIELKTGTARCWIQSFIDGANSSSGGALVFGTPSSATLGTERLRIDSSGRLLLGTTSVFGGGSVGELLQVGFSGGSRVIFGNTSSSLSNGTLIGQIDFNTKVGGTVSTGAAIKVNCDGSAASGDAPSRLTLHTTADGAASPTERLRITSDGKVGINDTNPAYHLSIEGTGAVRTEITCTNNNDAGAGVYFRTMNGGSMVSNATIRTDNAGNLQFYTGTSSDGERLRISGAGQIGMGKAGAVTVNGNSPLTIQESDSNSETICLRATNSGGNGSQPGIVMKTAAGGHIGGIYCDVNSDYMRFSTSGTDRLYISNAGKIGINNSSPSYMLEVENPNPGDATKQLIQRWVNNSQNTLELHMYGGSVDQVQFATTNSEQTLSFLTGRNTGSDVVSTQTSLLLTQNRDAWLQGPNTSNYGGALFIGHEASPYGNLCALRDSNNRPLIYLGGKYPEITLAHTVHGNTGHGPTLRFATYVQSTNTAYGSQFVIGTNGTGTRLDIGHATAAQNANVHNGISDYAGTTRFRVTTSGCQVFGTFSVSSTKNFKISHPLPEKTETHDLVHSSIEGPQADLIYRGVVDLVDGTATVNVDTAGRMTQGTFVALCTNVSCFTSNETDWTAVKGSISGNILTITAQDNTSTATVSWMVVGERKDQGMIDCPATDDNGRLITEPLKSS